MENMISGEILIVEDDKDINVLLDLMLPGMRERSF